MNIKNDKREDALSQNDKYQSLYDNLEYVISQEVRHKNVVTTVEYDVPLEAVAYFGIFPFTSTVVTQIFNK